MSGLKMDPMKIDLVLETIFVFCDVPSLENCRLVCTKWRDDSLKASRSKAVIKLGFNMSINPKLEFRDFLKSIDPGTDVDDYSLQLRKHPFKRYSVSFDEEATEEEYREEKRVAEFISRIPGSRVKIIWESNTFERFIELLSILNSGLLEELQVAWNTFDEGKGVPLEAEVLTGTKLKRLKLLTRTLFSGHCPERSLWAYLLTCFRNLEALSIAYGFDQGEVKEDYGMCLEDRLEIVTMLREMRESGGENVLPLKEFEMMMLVSVKQDDHDGNVNESLVMKNLVECKFPLERLSIQAGWHGHDDLLILPLLDSCKETLQYLKASVSFNSAFFCTSFQMDKRNQREKSEIKLSSFELEPGKVSMEALTEVSLLNGLEWAMFVLWHLETPNLEKLTVDFEKDRNQYDRYGLVAVTLPRGKIYEKLETFELFDNHRIPEGKTISSFAAMMPNLAHLTIPLDKKTFRMICQNFKGLKSLDILAAKSDYPELDDEALTGLSTTQLDKGDVSSRLPNITDLNHLSDLRISCVKQLRRDDVKFTDHAVIYGFLLLPRLYYLSIAFKELSEVVKDRLMTHVIGEVNFQKLEPTPGFYGVEILVEDESSDRKPMEENGNVEDFD